MCDLGEPSIFEFGTAHNKQRRRQREQTQVKTHATTLVHKPAAANLREPRGFQVGDEQDVEDDQHEQEEEHQESVERPGAVVVIRPVKPGFLLGGVSAHPQKVKRDEKNDIKEGYNS